MTLNNHVDDAERAERLANAVRAGGVRYTTTQILISPMGDWTRALSRTLRSNRSTRSCWVRGPYTSPFAIAGSYGQIILVASGIGITRARRQQRDTATHTWALPQTVQAWCVCEA